MAFGANQGAGLRRADRLARASFGEDHVPEIGLRGCEADADKAALLLFAHAGNETFHRFVGHLIENTDSLAGEKRGVHDDEGAVGADVLGVGLEVDGFAFGYLATDLQRDLKSDPDGPTAFRVASAMHEHVGGAFREASMARIK